ncbi:MAG TPA: efflux RND transporter periplasmic adaptor subunit, partial [Candidatus Luteimonas excrementigallinarum]|nr:efflux RND transporter periplasmic adaptor subunit [Candidatus Luteimonas excrementigallinarum]
MRAPNKWMLLAIGLLVLALLAWGIGKLRGPVLPGYEVVAGPMVQTVVATGRVAAPSRVQVGAEIAGLVLERRVMDGDRVEAGDVLVTLRARDLEARRDEARAALAALQDADLPDARARLRQVQADLAQAERAHARRRELSERQLVAREDVEQAAQAEIAARAAAEQARLAVQALAGGAREAQLRERLEAAEADLARAVIRASVPGVVLTRLVEPGDTVVPGDALLEIAADAPGEILLPLDEKNLARLEIGQSATCIADAFPDRPFAATVHHIAPGIDPARGTVDVRLRLDPAADFVRQDMTVTATII